MFPLQVIPCPPGTAEQETIACFLMEYSVFAYAGLLCFDAWRRGPSWFMTLVLGFVAGIGVEAGIIRTVSPTGIYYCYPQTFLRLFGVPIWVGLGWGMILYASTWTAYRMKLAAFPRALVAGALAVNIDFSIDPVAHYLGFWKWRFDGWTPAFKFFEVPFDNFVAWFGIVAGYSLFVRAGFRFVERRWPRKSAREWHWSDVAVPVLSVVALLLIFSQLRKVATEFYKLFNDLSCGQAVLFALLFTGGAYSLWRNARQARRDQPVSYIVLWVPLYFHFLMLGCVVFRNWQTFVSSAGAPASILLVLVPANLVVGLFAFVWPSLDVFLAKANEVGLERQKAKIVKLLKDCAHSLAVELGNYDRARPASGNLTRLPSKLAELILDPSPHADVLGGQTPLSRDGDDPLKRVADAVYDVLSEAQGRTAQLAGMRDAGRFRLPVPRRFPPAKASSLEWDRFADALVIQGAAALEGLPPPTTLERFRKETLMTYTGETVTCWVCSPTTIESLEDAFRFATAHRWRVTLRCGQHSFDVQSTNETLVISLEHFRDEDIFVDPENRIAIVGAANTWSEILSAAVAHGLVPYVMPTASGVTAGGSLSANTISRASGFVLREGAHVVEFQMVVPDHQGGGPALLTCSPEENPDLFSAAIGGLGYAGAVVSITHRLMLLELEGRPRAGAPFDDVAVQTFYETFRGLKGLGQKLEGMVDKSVRAAGSLAGSSGVEAITASLFLHGPNRGILGTSTYVSRHPNQLKRSLFHSPSSLAHRLFQFAAHVPLLRILGYWYVLNVLIRDGRTFTDELHGYTFFEDGNVTVRRWSRKWGVPLGILQQTFVVPADQGDRQLVTFLDEADRWLTDKRLIPALLDVLYVPRDARTFHLSSSSGVDAYIVSFSFETIGEGGFAKEEAFLENMTTRFSGQGVRVHLVKNVRGDRQAVSASYAGGIADMRRIREGHGASLLKNEFADRWLPGI